MKINQRWATGIAAAAFLQLVCDVAMAVQQPATATFTNAFGDGIWQRDQHIGVIGNPGDPNVPGNWDTGAYPNYNHVIQDPNTGTYYPNPNPDYDVIIALPTTCTIGPGHYDLEIRTLNVSSVSTLDIASQCLLGISNGSLVNNGTILVNSDDPVNNNSTIRFDNGGTATISGTGNIQLNGAQFGRATLTVGATMVTIANGQTIHGRGTLYSNGGTLINNGVINADVNGDPSGINIYFSDSAAGHRNNATIEATNGGLLLFGNGVIDQTGGGTFRADGAGSIVQLGISGPSYVFYLVGGIVTTSNGGVVEGVYGNMESVTNNGDFRIPANGSIGITGNGLTNNGTVVINSTDPVNSNALLGFAADGILGGTGSLKLDGASYGRATLSFSSHTVTIGSTQTVHGRGTINTAGGSMINQGTINADVNGDASGIQFYFADSALGQQNQGTIEATNGGLLLFGNGMITQSGNGKFLADGANSVVQLGISGPSYVFFLSGGVVTTAHGGVIEGVYGNMESVTNNGDFRIPGGGTVTITGSGLTNNGTLEVNSTDPDNSTSNLRFDTSGTLGGTGSLLLNGNTGNRANLIANALTLTNGSSHTIHGKGSIVGLGGTTLVNNGVVNADALPFGILISGGMNLTNNNLLEATAGSKLILDRLINDQTSGGNLVADGSGSAVQIGSAFDTTIKSGTMNGRNGGVIESLYGILDGTITNSGAYEILPNGHTLVDAPSLTNNGRMTLDATSTMRFDLGNTVIGGPGAIVMTDGANMIINGGQSVTNSDGHTIRGDGSIAIVGGGKLTNNGTIVPGLSPGTLTVNGDLELNFPSTLSLEIGGTAQGTGYSRLNKIDQTALALNGKLTVRLLNNFVPAAADNFMIVTTPVPLAGAFTNVHSGGRMNTTDGQGSFEVTYSGMNNALLSDNVILSNYGPPLPASRSENISTRGRVQTGDNVLIGGVIVTGTVDKPVIVRAIGPSLANLGVAGALADPTLELYDSTGALIASNDNWRDTQEAQIQATGIPPMDDRESAIVRTLSPGAYTAVVRGKNSTSGVALVEIYDLAPTSGSQLSNISTRGFVDIGANVLIGGVIVGPVENNGRQILVRALGPSLTARGVVGALADPTLEIHDGNGVTLAANDNWQDSQAVDIAATSIPPTDPRESAIILTLAPGNYTAIVSGQGNTTGVGLVEVYSIQ